MPVKQRPGFPVSVDRTNKSTEGRGLYLDIPAGGSIQVRFTPTSIATGELFFESSQHFQFKQDGEKRAWACLNVHGEGSCPICQTLLKLVEQLGENGAKEYLKKHNASNRWHAQVIQVPAEGGDKPSQTVILGLSKTTAQKISAILKSERDNRLPLLSDPDKGQAIIVSRNNGTGFATRYEVMATGLRLSLDDLFAGWEEKFLDLEKALKLRVADRATLVASLRETIGPALFDKLGVK